MLLESFETEKEINITKLTLKGETSDKIKEMFIEIDYLMLRFTNRDQSVKVKELVANYERKTKKTFDVEVFRAMLSVFPEALSTKLVNNELHIFMEGEKKPINPSKLNKIIENLQLKLAELEEEKAWYIDLINLEESQIFFLHKIPMEILKENIVKFNDTDDYDNGDEDIELNEDQNKNSFENILKVIRKRSRKKKERENKFNKIDWQGKSIPKMARMVNNAFMSEQKIALSKDKLIEKIKYMGYSSENMESDLDRLLRASNGWLREWKGWIRRNSQMDVNNICNELLIKD